MLIRKLQGKEVPVDGGLVVGQFGKVLGPQPADHVVGIVLVLGKPKLALFGDDIEYLVHVSTSKCLHM